MIYYRAKREVRFWYADEGHMKYSGFVPEESLITLKEFRRYLHSDTAVPYDSQFDEVHLSPKDTYMFFGFRFAYDDEELFKDSITIEC